MKNIILIGMSGAGKSTLGVLLAKILNKGFVDTDLLLQQQESKLLQEIIQEKGVQGFKAIEEQMLLSFQVQNSVVSTGGSVIYSEKGMRKLQESGIILYLDVAYNEIEKRISNLFQRGIVMEEGQTLQQLYEERKVLYEKFADKTIIINSETIEETVARICERLGEKV
ncbi:MAG: shikimate kinase [Vallitaleaceae bacterium]|nr:shikimate kinase [Vallitaleaceae bacterium]